MNSGSSRNESSGSPRSCPRSGPLRPLTTRCATSTPPVHELKRERTPNVDVGGLHDVARWVGDPRFLQVRSKAVMKMSLDNPEKWKTIRDAISGGWGPTLRYVLIVSAGPAIAALGALALASRS